MKEETTPIAQIYMASRPAKTFAMGLLDVSNACCHLASRD